MHDRRSIRLHVDRHLRTALDAVPAEVRRRLETVLAERRLLTPDPAPYFGPLGHPLFELPVWVASRLGDDGTEIPEEALADVLGVSALGYLHVRAQDDWLDGATRDDPGLVALAEALMALCIRLLVPVAGPSRRFWDLHAEVLTAYAGSLIRADQLRRDGAPVARADFEQLLAQSRPLILPTAALLARADRWDLLAPLEEFVFTATAASQLVNDLTDVHRDRAAGHRTWPLQVVGASGVEALWATEGPVHDLVQEALSFHRRSALAARALAPVAAEPWITERRGALESLPETFRASVLAGFVERLGRSSSRTEQESDLREERSS